MSLVNIVSYDDQGEVTSIRAVPENEAELYQPYLLFNSLVSKDTHYVENGEFVQKPEKPSAYHIFDFAIKQWILPENAAIEIKSREQEAVKKLGIVASDEPILFEGKSIDADSVARENIRNTIDRLTFEAEQGINSGNLFWIDAYGNKIDWNDSAIYLAWLKRLHVAISNRKAGLVLTYKAEKDKIQSASATELVAVKPKNKGG